METTLKLIYDFAADAHAGQTRKYSPDPYIVHPNRVMQLCRQYDARLPVLAAALLHDVLEDTPVSERELGEYLQRVMPNAEAAETLRLVVELTDVFVKSAFPKLNRRTRKEKELERLSKISSAAQTVKYADIYDNVGEIASDDPGFAPRYIAECRSILKKLDRGNPELYAKSIDAVEKAAKLVQRR